MNIVLLRVGAGSIAFEYEGTRGVSNLRASKAAIGQALALLAGRSSAACDAIVEDGVIVDIIEIRPVTSGESLP